MGAEAMPSCSQSQGNLERTRPAWPKLEELGCPKPWWGWSGRTEVVPASRWQHRLSTELRSWRKKIGALAGSLHPPRLPKPWGVPQGAHFVVGPREASQGQWQLGSDWETPRTAPICLLARDPMIGPSMGGQAAQEGLGEEAAGRGT